MIIYGSYREIRLKLNIITDEKYNPPSSSTSMAEEPLHLLALVFRQAFGRDKLYTPCDSGFLRLQLCSKFHLLFQRYI